MGEITVRAAEAEDTAFLEDMLVEAANWPSHRDRGRADTLADPRAAHYIEGWPRASDLGVVAVDARGRRVGAAWLRYFSEADPGYGFVAADTPEVATAVVADRRGRGVGRLLLRALAERARADGVPRISLSVERANTAAVALYRSEGYRVVGGTEHAETMLLDLR